MKDLQITKPQQEWQIFQFEMVRVGCEFGRCVVQDEESLVVAAFHTVLPEALPA